MEAEDLRTWHISDRGLEYLKSTKQQTDPGHAKLEERFLAMKTVRGLPLCSFHFVKTTHRKRFIQGDKLIRPKEVPAEIVEENISELIEDLSPKVKETHWI